MFKQFVRKRSSSTCLALSDRSDDDELEPKFQSEYETDSGKIQVDETMQESAKDTTGSSYIEAIDLTQDHTQQVAASTKSNSLQEPNDIAKSLSKNPRFLIPIENKKLSNLQSSQVIAFARPKDSTEVESSCSGKLEGCFNLKTKKPAAKAVLSLNKKRKTAPVSDSCENSVVANKIQTEMPRSMDESTSSNTASQNCMAFGSNAAISGDPSACSDISQNSVPPPSLESSKMCNAEGTSIIALNDPVEKTDDNHDFDSKATENDTVVDEFCAGLGFTFDNYLPSKLGPVEDSARSNRVDIKDGLIKDDLIGVTEHKEGRGLTTKNSRETSKVNKTSSGKVLQGEETHLRDKNETNEKQNVDNSANSTNGPKGVFMKAIPVVAIHADTKKFLGHFQSIRKASESQSVSTRTIKKVLDGKLKSWNGILWQQSERGSSFEYKEDSFKQDYLPTKGRKRYYHSASPPQLPVVMVANGKTDDISSVLTQSTATIADVTDISDVRSSTIMNKSKRKVDDLPTMPMKKKNSNSNHSDNDSDDLGNKETGWWHGNGIDRYRIRVFANADLKVSSTCRGCQNMNCGKCGLCQFGKCILNRRACILKCCDRNSEIVKKLFIDEIIAMRSRPERCLNPDTRVYCRWPENNQFYWGKIKKRYQISAVGMFLSIIYDDGDRHPRVSEKDARDELELKLEEEETRLVDSFNDDKRASDTFVGLVKNTDFAESLQRNSLDSDWSEEKSVGARCYARFTNDELYWGKIVEVIRIGSNTKFDIEFDDGDFLPNIEDHHVYTEKEANTKFGAFHDKAPSLSLIELFRQRCGSCRMCQKPDCGKCKGCSYNVNSTSLHRRVCVLKMCSKIPVNLKVQASLELPKYCRYYFTDENCGENCKEDSICYSVCSLWGLRFVSRDNKIFDCLKKLAKTFSSPKHQSYNIISKFLGKELGTKLRLEKQHELIGKGFFRAWCDACGRRREVYGKIVKCYSVLNTDDFDQLLFTVTYEESRNDLKAFPAPVELSVPLLDENIELNDAYGGYLDFLEITGKTLYSSLPGSETKPHFKWIVPQYRLKKRNLRDRIHLLVVRHQGFELTFQAKDSGIPNAGLGLWVSCLPLSSEIGSYFVLQAGHKIDLGVYAPLLGTGRKTESQSLVKQFLYNWEGEIWSFDTHHREDIYDVFDITSNVTGELHEEAKNNVLIYANETDGHREIPTVHAHHDPEGSVHYLMGHAEDQGPFKLLANGEQIELKADYGELYEKVRVRKGYGRVEGQELEKLKCSVEKQDNVFYKMCSVLAPTQLMKDYVSSKKF